MTDSAPPGTTPSWEGKKLCYIFFWYLHQIIIVTIFFKYKKIIITIVLILVIVIHCHSPASPFSSYSSSSPVLTAHLIWGEERLWSADWHVRPTAWGIVLWWQNQKANIMNCDLQDHCLTAPPLKMSLDCPNPPNFLGAFRLEASS